MKRISFLVIILVLLFIILRLSTSIYALWHKQDLLTNANEALRQAQKENAVLRKQLVTVKSSQFLDQEARDKLLLVKSGETDVLIDQNLLQASASAKQKGQKPFWQQWLSLFF